VILKISTEKILTTLQSHQSKARVS
jgi:hypothetical protein